MKIAEISSLYSPPWLAHFLVAKMSKAQWGSDRNMVVIMEICGTHGQPPLYSENY